MSKRIIIRNKSGAEFQIMLEPLTTTEDVHDGKSLTIEGAFDDSDLIIDVHADNSISIWTDPEAFFQRPR